MLSKKAKSKLEETIGFLTRNKQWITIDGDTHPSDLGRLDGDLLAQYRATENYYQGRPISAEELLEEMRLAGVDVSLTWQNPSMLEYSSDKELNYRKLRQANEDILRFGNTYPGKFISAGWTDPKALGVDLAIRLVEECVMEFGFPIVKMNPAQNAYPIDSPDVVKVAEKIVELGATPAFHYGGDTPYTPASGLEYLATYFSGQTIIGVHMGGGGSHYVDGDALYIETRQLGLRQPNLFFILSAKRDCHIESDLITYTLAGEPYSKNLSCGSDAPYGRQSWNFGGFVKMFKSLQDGANHTDRRLKKNPTLFTDSIIQDYLGRNLANLVIKSANKVLQKNGALKIIL